MAAGADMIFAEAVTELSMYTAIPASRRRADPGQHYRVRQDAAVYARGTGSGRRRHRSLLLWAYRAMNAAALKVYETIRAEGTQAM